MPCAARPHLVQESNWIRNQTDVPIDLRQITVRTRFAQHVRQIKAGGDTHKDCNQNEASGDSGDTQTQKTGPSIPDDIIHVINHMIVDWGRPFTLVELQRLVNRCDGMYEVLRGSAKQVHVCQFPQSKPPMSHYI